MGKKIAAVQSSYIPWKGYFDLIHAADEFVLFDDVQYTRRDWRNRNRIKTRAGAIWLTIPVNAKGNFLAPVKDITISDPAWGERHWRSIVAAYARAPHFDTYAALLEPLYLTMDERHLSVVNRRFIEALCGALGIRTKISWSMDYEIEDGKNERLVSLCRQAGADVYVSGPSAQAYIDVELFRRGGVEVEFFDYAGYPEYLQAYPPFDHQVSVLDLLFQTGPNAPRHMLTFVANREMATERQPGAAAPPR